MNRFKTCGFLTVAFCMLALARADDGGVSAGDVLTFADGANVASPVRIDYVPGFSSDAVVKIDGEKILDSTSAGTFSWQPRTTGMHTLEHLADGKTLTEVYNVTNIVFWTPPAPKPPMAKVSTVTNTPASRSFTASGGGGAILTKGSGNWTAAVSDDWITLKATSGVAGTGKTLAYVVAANSDMEMRVGYVYVAGSTHVITQVGVGATLSKTSDSFGREGGSNTVRVTPSNTTEEWRARPNCDWIHVTPTSGTGAADVTYTVAPWYARSSRSATVTVGGTDVKITQAGSAMSLSSLSAACDGYAHTVSIGVNADSSTTWGATANADWITVVGAGSGKGSGTVKIAVAEDLGYKTRKGTVTVGTETFTIRQTGLLSDVSFSISQESLQVGLNGADGSFAVDATADLVWTATSDASWVTISSECQSGEGGGKISYSVSPQTTLYERTATITVKPEAESGLDAKTFTVTQEAVTSSLSLLGYEFAATGETVRVSVSVPKGVEWKVEGLPDWVTESDSLGGPGSGWVELSASTNVSVSSRSETVKIAGRDFVLTQKGRAVEVTLEYGDKVFGADGGDGSLSIHPDGDASWEAVASDEWIIIFDNATGTGDASILYIISPFDDDTEKNTSRTGTITIGDQVVYISQCAYSLSISSAGSSVSGVGGSGTISVSTDSANTWTAVATASWVTIDEDTTSGTGNGTIRFAYSENMTGKPRTAKIIIAGKVYTLTQAVRTLVAVFATAGRGGSASGSGAYDLGGEVTLEAVAASGYEFEKWTLPDGKESTDNPLVVTVDAEKSYAASFLAKKPEITAIQSTPDGVTLTWSALAWADEYRVWRGKSETSSAATKIATVAGGVVTTWLDATGDAEQSYWYWVEAVGKADSAGNQDDTWSDPKSGMKQKPLGYSAITYANLKGAANPNPSFYQEGTGLALVTPGVVDGYTFAGWTPSAITADMTGDQTITANWKANTYTIKYDANDGEGVMDATSATYDSDATVAANGFTRKGYQFLGWATEKDGEVVYDAGAKVSNLVSTQGGSVTLYAVWERLPMAISDVKVTSIAPWGLAIDYQVGNADEDVASNLVLNVSVVVDGVTNVAQTVAGETNCVNGAHRVYWNMAADGLSFADADAEVVVSYARQTSSVVTPLYCVIDLSGGANTNKYQVEYFASEPAGGFNATEYKTTKLVLKRVDAGSFIMGEDQSNEKHRVTLTKPFYMGLFEVTQKQWKLVTGGNPSKSVNEVQPVERVSYNAIRGETEGANWPATNSVDSTSFLGKLRDRTKIDFDLPTEAQWEYTCRAKSTTTYGFGDSVDGDFVWYKDNSSSKPHEVGTRKPNDWGFYDMHGNVGEWCLDWYGDLTYGENPVGLSSATYRVHRGGTWSAVASQCASYSRWNQYDWHGNYSDGDFGFRLAGPVDEQVVIEGTSAEEAFSVSASASNVKVSVIADGGDIAGRTALSYAPHGSTNVVVMVDGVKVVDSAQPGTFSWSLRTVGEHTLVHAVGDVSLAATYNVTEVAILDPVPAIAADGDVAAALDGASDARLAEKITTATKYTAYRTWVDGVAGTDLEDTAVIAKRQTIKDAAHAWLGYALDLGYDATLALAPKQGDLTIATFENGAVAGGTATLPSGGAAVSAGGSWTLTVAIDGISVGANATAVNLAEAIVVEGATTLGDAAFSSSSVTATFSPTTDGKVSISIKPTDATASTFFIRVKLTP